MESDTVIIDNVFRRLLTSIQAKINIGIFTNNLFKTIYVSCYELQLGHYLIYTLLLMRPIYE